LHPTDADRIAHPWNDDRDGARELHQYRDHPAAGGDDDVRVRGHQACCVRPHARHIVSGPTLVELNIAAFGPSELCELLPQRASAAFVFGIALGIGHDNPHAPHSACRLCARRKRPRRRRATEQRDEVAPPQVDHEAYSSRPSQPTTEGATGPWGTPSSRGIGRSDSIVPEAARRWRCQQGFPSARRPASVIRTRVTSIGQLPAGMRSAWAVASPASIRSAIRSIEKPCAQPSPSARTPLVQQKTKAECQNDEQ
jgi:hypothetical protein